MSIPAPAFVPDLSLDALEPESLVTQMLGSALHATRKTMAFVHPDILDLDLHLPDIDHPSRLAYLILIACSDLDRLLDAYHQANNKAKFRELVEDESEITDPDL